MAEKDDGLIGFDPLAWMNEESTDEPQSESEQEATAADLDVVTEEKQPSETEVIVEDKTVSATDTEIPDNSEAADIDSDDSKMTLEATLNIQNVNDLYEQLITQLETKEKIEIDASAVVSIDTASLQLLIVLKQSAVQLHKEVIIDFPSDQFIEAAELLGLSEMLEVDQAAAGLF